MDGLRGAGHEVWGVDVVAGDDIVVADLARDDDALPGVLDGTEAIVHLAAIASETDFATAVESHIAMTQRVPQAAVVAGVPRVVYASSNHAVGFTPRAPLVHVDTPVRPDSFYGFGKAACEALCSLYHDRHGLAIACLRIGSFRDRPTTRRHLSTWLSPGDAVRLVDACLRAAELGFAYRVWHLGQLSSVVGPDTGASARVRTTRRRRGVGTGDPPNAADSRGRTRRSGAGGGEFARPVERGRRAKASTNTTATTTRKAPMNVASVKRDPANPSLRAFGRYGGRVPGL